MGGIQAILDRHIENGRFYDRALANIPGLCLCRCEPTAEPAYWLYTVLAERRDDLTRYLTEAGIQCSQAHRRNDEHSVFTASRSQLPGLDCFYSRMLHIPCGWWVTGEQREYVADCLRRGW